MRYSSIPIQDMKPIYITKSYNKLSKLLQQYYIEMNVQPVKFLNKWLEPTDFTKAQQINWNIPTIVPHIEDAKPNKPNYYYGNNDNDNSNLIATNR